MRFLSEINSPADLRQLKVEDLQEVADEVAAAARNDLDPALGIRPEFLALAGVDVVADEARDGHGSVLARER